ncbi:hypothetical protein JCM3774_004724 [Rhodotorula dairenensis]
MEQGRPGSRGREPVPPPRDTAGREAQGHSRTPSDSKDSTASSRSGGSTGPGCGSSGAVEERRQPSHGSVPSTSAGSAASRPDSASPVPSASDGGVRSDPSGPTSPASSHARPPSALSSTSSSHPRGLSSPRSNQPSYTSSSLSSAAAFDYDDLLGPRRAHSSTTGPSLSPPSSNEGDKRSGGPRLRGLGFDSAALPASTASSRERARSGQLGGEEVDWVAGDLLEDPNPRVGEIDETWLRLNDVRLDHPTSPPGASAPAPYRSQPTPAGGGAASTGVHVGSPLSPLVAPFAPSSVSSTSQQGEQRSARPNPWSSSASASSLASLAERTREREASWASSSPGLASTTSSQRAFPHLSSPSSFSPSPAIPCSSQMANNAQAYFSSQTPVQTSSLCSYDSTVQDTPNSTVSTGVYPTRHPSYASTLIPESAATLDPYSGVDRAMLSRYGSLQAVPTTSGPASTSGADSVSSGSVDEVTTVFVVGFPDDMTEREFQNMFTFAEGFEAASLKLPTPADDEAASRPSQDDGPPFSTLPQYLLHATRDPFALPREAAATPLNGGSSGSANGGGGGVAPRKQIIGFARFVTRQHALAAADILSGRKVDPEKSMVLKAEMAKKNLHFKKSAAPSVTGVPDASNSASTSTTTTLAPLPPVAASLASQQQHQQYPQSGFSRMPTTPIPNSQPVAPSAASSLEAAAASVAAAATTAASAMGGSGPSIPLSALDSSTLAKLASVSNLNPAVLAEIARQSALAGPKPAAPSAVSVAESYRPSGELPPPRRRESYSTISGYEAGADVYADSTPSSTAPQPQLSPGGPEPVFGRPSPYTSVQQPFEGGYKEPARAQLSHVGDQAALVAQAMLRQQQQQQHHEHQQQQQLHRARESSGPARGQPYVAFPTVAGGGPPAQQPAAALQSPPLGGYAAPRTQNPADMNAPKNTLYVGGLPAVLPSLTGPFSASHLEDSLRNAFSRCPGFKRLQFRSKSNGPIVFVEFVDTAHATRAMQELYGHTLGGLVKGGIRLSYSKNPLGVRSNGLASGHPSPMPFQQASMSGGGGGLEGLSSSPYANSPFAHTPGPVASSGQFDPFDPHRRPPDPIYGENSYSNPNQGTAGLARSPPALSPLSQPSLASASSYNFPAAPGSQTSPGAHSANLYGGNFSPFGFDP